MSQHERFGFATREALSQKIRELGVDIPLSDDVGILLTPTEVGGRRVPNRFAVQPMEGRDGQADGSPGSLTFRRYQRYAAGGSGLIWFEATAVAPEGRGSPAQLHLHEANVGEFRQLVTETRAAARRSSGAVHEPLLIVQLTHCGRYSNPDGNRRPIIAHHNTMLDPLAGVSSQHPLITDDELDRLQETYLHAAELAAAAGFDGVDIKACHGYLVSELLAAFTRANSRYGGPFENRARFLVEVVVQIRQRLPDLIVTSRFNAFDGIPRPFGFGTDEQDPPREDLAEPQELARRLRAAGCPLLNVSLGNPHYASHYGRPFDKPLVGARCPDEHPLVSVARLLRTAGAVQQVVPDVPIVGTGYSWLRQHIPNVGAGVIKAGGAAIVGLGRGAFAYPDCVMDLAEHGAFDARKACVTCSQCSQIMRDEGRVGCVVHDQEIYAKQYTEGRSRMVRPARQLREG